MKKVRKGAVGTARGARVAAFAVAAAVVVVLAAFLTAGCGGSTTTTTGAPAEPTTVSTEAAVTTTVPAPATTVAQETVFQQAEKASFDSLGEVPTASKPWKLGHLMITLQNPFWVTLGQGSEDAAKKYGLAITTQSAPTEGDVTSQLNTLQTMTGQEYDALLVHTITADNLVPGIIEALKKGIKVVDADGRVNTTAIKEAGLTLPQLNMIDFVKQGAMGADYIAKALNTPGAKVAIIEGLSGAPQSDARAKGAKDAFEAAGLTVVASQPGNWDSAVSLNVATNILQANPDLKGIYAANDVMALAAAEAVAQAGKQGQVVIVGTDFIEDGKKAIEDGRMAASVAFSPYIVGELAVAATLRILEGLDVPSDLQVTNVVIDKSNVGLMSDWK